MEEQEEKEEQEEEHPDLVRLGRAEQELRFLMAAW